MSAKLGWVLALALLVPGACGGDLAINFENDGSADSGSGGSAGSGGKAAGGEGGESAGGQDGSSSGSGGESDGSGGTGVHDGGSAGRGGGLGQGGSSQGGAGGTSGGSGGAGGTSGAGGSGGVETCGNGELDEGEDCDDDNVTNGDGCSSDCKDTCELCMAANCVEGGEPVAPYCFSMPGTGTKGAGAGIPKSELCDAMVACVQAADCYDDAYGVKPCFCGDAEEAKCAAEGAAGPNGVCYDEMFAAVEGVYNADFLQYGWDIQYPSGYATILLDCTYAFCRDECFAK